MKKNGSVRNVLALCILILNFLGNLLLHICQKEKIGPKIVAKVFRVAAALYSYTNEFQNHACTLLTMVI